MTEKIVELVRKPNSFTPRKKRKLFNKLRQRNSKRNASDSSQTTINNNNIIINISKDCSKKKKKYGELDPIPLTSDEIHTKHPEMADIFSKGHNRLVNSFFLSYLFYSFIYRKKSILLLQVLRNNLEMRDMGKVNFIRLLLFFLKLITLLRMRPLIFKIYMESRNINPEFLILIMIRKFIYFFHFSLEGIIIKTKV